MTLHRFTPSGREMRPGVEWDSMPMSSLTFQVRVTVETVDPDSFVARIHGPVGVLATTEPQATAAAAHRAADQIIERAARKMFE